MKIQSRRCWGCSVSAEMCWKQWLAPLRSAWCGRQAVYPEGSLELLRALSQYGWLMVNVLLCPWKLWEDLEEQDCCPSTCSSETGVYNTVIVCSKFKFWSLWRQTAHYNGSLVPNSHPFLGPELVPTDVYNKLLWFVTSTWFSQSRPFFFSFLPACGRGIAAPSVKYAGSGNKMHQQPWGMAAPSGETWESFHRLSVWEPL